MGLPSSGGKASEPGARTLGSHVALTPSALSPLQELTFPQDTSGPLHWMRLRLLFSFDILKASVNENDSLTFLGCYLLRL